MKNAKRAERLLPQGKPRYIRCYDNGGATIDRYTVVFTGRYRGRRGQFVHVGMDHKPYDPQGFCQHGFNWAQIDRPTYGHIGRKIAFGDLPAKCQSVVLSDYLSIWGLPA